VAAEPDVTGQREERRRIRSRYRREDGVEFERIVFFTDAVFAIAMTLLIVAVEPPSLEGPEHQPHSLLDPLRGLGPELFSFFLAFLLLGRYWMAHHAFVSTLVSIDRPLIGLTLVYLAFVAFLPFPTEVMGKYEDNPISVVAFALSLAAISGMEAVLFRHAGRYGHLREKFRPEVYRYRMIQSLIPVALFIATIPLAFWNPTIAWVLWFLSIPLGILVARRSRTTAGWYSEQGDARPS
jgi:uncharacterized membrane protein